MDILDISVPIVEGMAVWEGDPPVRIEQVASIERDGANVSMISFSLHTGTHIDSPMHYLQGGMATDQIELDNLVGDVLVVEIPENIRVIEKEQIQELVNGCFAERLLFKTSNSKEYPKKWRKFSTDFVALSVDAAIELSKLNLRLIGIDAPSIALYGAENEVHRAFLSENTVILEGTDLSQVNPGLYWLVCLPLKIEGVEGTPVRAILLPKSCNLSF
jgi:arylformamidase